MYLIFQQNNVCEHIEQKKFLTVLDEFYPVMDRNYTKTLVKFTENYQVSHEQ